MNRRAFLTRAAALAALAAIDVEQLLWTPSKRIFLPPAGGWRIERELYRVTSIYPDGGMWYINGALSTVGSGIQVGDVLEVRLSRSRDSKVVTLNPWPPRQPSGPARSRLKAG